MLGNVTILFFYFIGLALLLKSLDTKDDIKGLIHLTVSIYASVMGYYLSFNDTDYTQASYFPMGMLVVAIILAVFRIWGFFNPIKEDESDAD